MHPMYIDIYLYLAFRFCDSIPEMAVPQMSVSTSNYPATVVTNPTCECTFKSSNDVSYVEGIVTCNVSRVLPKLV